MVTLAKVRQVLKVKTMIELFQQGWRELAFAWSHRLILFPFQILLCLHDYSPPYY